MSDEVERIRDAWDVRRQHGNGERPDANEIEWLLAHIDEQAARIEELETIVRGRIVGEVGSVAAKLTRLAAVARVAKRIEEGWLVRTDTEEGRLVAAALEHAFDSIQPGDIDE